MLNNKSNKYIDFLDFSVEYAQYQPSIGLGEKHHAGLARYGRGIDSHIPFSLSLRHALFLGIISRSSWNNIKTSHITIYLLCPTWILSYRLKSPLKRTRRAADVARVEFARATATSGWFALPVDSGPFQLYLPTSGFGLRSRSSSLESKRCLSI